MRFAICNETFEGWEHERVCRFVAEVGYTGLEIAPFTLAPLITQVSAEERQRLRGQAESAGIQIIGLHWLLARTEGLHITSPDQTVRGRTADYLVELARCCRDLGGDLLVLGSPAQRRLLPGVSREQGWNYGADTLRQALPRIADYGVRLCLEPLGESETDFINSCAEGVELLNCLHHPNFVLHQDVKAMSAESTPIPELIRRYRSQTAHFHVNDPNKRGPGFGEMDFVPILQALLDAGYDGWVSVEVFDYTPDPETIARESYRYLRACLQKCTPATAR
jgi:sugar phosphate isomerase/epimerase